MTDSEIFEKIIFQYLKKVPSEIEKKRLIELIEQLQEINYVGENGNILFTLFANKTDSLTDLDKEIIDLCLKKGIDKNFRFGRNNSTLLFSIINNILFEYLCQNGFDPNTRLNQETNMGLPYFFGHYEFHNDIYKTAKTYGFKPTQPVEGTTNLLNSILARYAHKLSLVDLKELTLDFNELKDAVDENSGKAPLHSYGLAHDLNDGSLLEYLGYMKNVLNYNFDVKTTKEAYDTEFTYPEGSTLLEMYQIQNEYFQTRPLHEESQIAFNKLKALITNQPVEVHSTKKVNNSFWSKLKDIFN